MVVISWLSNPAAVYLMASAPVQLSTDKIQHIKQPPMLTMFGQHQNRHAANTNYWYCWTNADLQKRPAPIQSTVDRMWFKISTKICYNSTINVLTSLSLDVYLIQRI